LMKFGYVPLGDNGAEFLFQVISNGQKERH
jgi:hypothetical protein